MYKTTSPGSDLGPGPELDKCDGEATRLGFEKGSKTEIKTLLAVEDSTKKA